MIQSLFLLVCGLSLLLVARRRDPGTKMLLTVEAFAFLSLSLLCLVTL